ncbi:1,4-alpha-glucan branching protein GlgB [Haematomicrobium sanguinis]|uniref:1,4-alpha-glucan branching protein GlgB n=1 Tax=Haematomicrobium sanguinis TaxID=479106 RepID=UPI0004799EE8|nr:1,4-alpha-glucan branching protein GlgB [Haematomicrobium sanguinis]
MSLLTTSLQQLLHEWLPTRRWFPGHASETFELFEVGGFALEDPQGIVDLQVLMLQVKFADRQATLFVPLTIRESKLPDLESWFVGKVQHEGAGQGQTDAFVYDGTADPVFVTQWLELARAQVAGALLSAGSSADVQLHSLPDLVQVRPLLGEQSNTSVVVTGAWTPLMVKFFRVIGPGENLDRKLTSGLEGAGAEYVPATHAWFQCSWMEDTSSGGEAPVRGDVCVVREFLAETQEAYEMASRLAASGADFTEHAQAIGEVTGRMHRDLRRVYGSSTPTESARIAFMSALTDRLRAQWEQVVARVEGAEASAADSADPAAALDRIIDEAAAMDEMPTLQLIHGDFHLGQLLFEGAGNWFILDFEGEPLREHSDRGQQDIPARDVAGMLRSFDYASWAGGQRRAEFSAAAQRAFLGGYNSTAPVPLKDDPLLTALLADKALYEVRYELRNRPEFVPIPAEALRILLGGPDAAAAAAAEVATPEVAVQDGDSTDMQRHDESSPDATTLGLVAAGRYHQPHAVLGAHLIDENTVQIRTLKRFADRVDVVTERAEYPMHHEVDGIWVASIPAESPGRIPDYRIGVTYPDSEPYLIDDPYRFLPTLGELDLHLIAEGRHEELWKVLGAHTKHYSSKLGDVAGTAFAVWAPNAQAVRVNGDFNSWDGTGAAMRSLGSSGIWEIFIPGVEAGALYKYEVLGKDGVWRDKADPVARFAQVPPENASIVVESHYQFGDQEWMARRAASQPHADPISIYEVHLGSWRPGLGYRELAEQLVEYVTWQGFTHVEFMPVAEHPFGGSWGYQVTGYYAPTSRFGHPDDFRYLVDTLHQAGIGVIVDWVPAHFPKDEWALARFDGEPLYEHADPALGEHPDWGTLIFDFGRNEVRNFLVANALYWFEEFHVDGLRVDAVASMLYLDYSREDGQWRPNRYGGRENLEAIAFLQETNATAYKRYPGIMMIAEESTSFPGVTKPTSEGGLGFGFKWNMGWMNDSLQYMEEDPVNRKWHHDKITFSMVYAYSENYILPISHDEVVHGKGSLLRKMPGDRWQQLANVRAYLAFQWAHPGKQLLFMGTEFAQEGEWSQEHGLEWWMSEQPAHRGVMLLVKALNELYRSTPALHELDTEPRGFAWIKAHDGDANVLAFSRTDGAGRPVVFVVNFAGGPHEDYRIGVPVAGEWDEVLNTDASEFGGSGVVNASGLVASAGEYDGQPASLSLRVPPLGAVFLKPKSA